MQKKKDFAPFRAYAVDLDSAPSGQSSAAQAPAASGWDKGGMVVRKLGSSHAAAPLATLGD